MVILSDKIIKKTKTANFYFFKHFSLRYAMSIYMSVKTNLQKKVHS